MKEINLLPDWYKSNRRKRFSCMIQYAALATVLFIMVVWNVVAVSSLSRTTRLLAQAEKKEKEIANDTKEFSDITNQIKDLSEKDGTLDKIGSKIDIPAVLAELSFLVNEKIILDELNLKAEELVEKTNATNSFSTGLRNVSAKSSKDNNLVFGQVKFKLDISGVATNSSDVADLVCRLEDSPYFFNVAPLFSRNRKITGTKRFANKNYQVSEFRIGCYLANYQHEMVAVSKQSQTQSLKW